MSETLSDSELHAVWSVVEEVRLTGIWNGMYATLPSMPGHRLKVSFFRGLPTDFPERDQWPS
ncbi:hypothetical protein [Actinocrispum sp. NPDC049592]|uniref:hypothetical protein n=1 Tax=Actinocrispum sp. NPDC049592 TaxID=3154835 RepID=UPI00341B5AB4